jgi:AcrR family transcriptional regulator
MQGTKAPNKHELQSLETRRALLLAAEKIFARDGYERAQIDEIARECGRTRGAVYAQFETKEKLFFALQELRVSRARQDIEALATATENKDPRAKRAALREYYASTRGPQLSILDLELKLYALRHPDCIGNWRERYSKVYTTEGFTEVYGIGEDPGRSRMRTRSLALTAIKSALEIAREFQPEEFSQKEIGLLLSELFDGLFPDEPSKTDTKRASRKRGSGKQ